MKTSRGVLVEICDILARRTAVSGVDDALLHILADAYLEIFPARGIEEKLEVLPAGSYVAITCSPRKGISACRQASGGKAITAWRVSPTA